MSRPLPPVATALCTVLLAAHVAAQVPPPTAPEERRAMGQALADAAIGLAEAVTKAEQHVSGRAWHATFVRARVGTTFVPRFEVDVLKEGEPWLVVVDGRGDVLSARVREEADDVTALRVFDFEGQALPPALQPAETAGTGNPARWHPVEIPPGPRGKQAVAVETTNRGATYNLLLTRGKVGPDVSLGVHLQAWKGEEDQGGGLVWRAKDPNNYYVVRWNPLEHNLRLYTVVDGQRSAPLQSVDIGADGEAWHTLDVVMKGSRIEIRFDGGLVLEAKDETFREAGAVGLWTKADASTRFDAFSVQPAK